MRILVSAVSFSDACSWYRSLGPWSEIAKEYEKISVSYVTHPSWADIKAHDCLFLQRPSTREQWQALNSAKQFDIPVVVDYDDDLIRIPQHNPAYEIYAGEKSQIRAFIELADHVVVSTDYLRDAFVGWNSKITVIPNALDECLLKFSQRQVPEKTVMWRGTQTHNRDVGTIANELALVAEKHPDYRFMFLGADPWDVTDRIKNSIAITTPMNPVTFFSSMAFLRPKVLFVPLQDTPFNRSKSNIAALEGTLSGAAVLAPDWDEWKMEGVTNYSTSSEFRDKLDELIAVDTSEKVAAAWSYVKKYFMLHDVNEMRVELLHKLLYP